MRETEYTPVENFNPGSQDYAGWANAGGARPVVKATPPIVDEQKAKPTVVENKKADTTDK